MSALQVATKAGPESDNLGPVAQRFFRVVFAIAFFLAPPILLYTLYVLSSVFILHRSP